MKACLRAIFVFMVLSGCSPTTTPPSQLVPSGWVTGRVSGLQNLPLPYYRIVLRGDSRSISILTDWGGKFCFDGVPVGNYALSMDSMVLSSVSVVEAETSDVGALSAFDSILPVDFSIVSAYVRHHGASEFGWWHLPYGMGPPITVYAGTDTVDLATYAVGNLTNGPWILSTKDVVQFYLNGERLGDSSRLENSYYISSSFLPRGVDTLDMCAPCEKVLKSNVNRCPRARFFVKRLPTSGFKDSTASFTGGLIALAALSGDTALNCIVGDKMPLIVPAGDLRLWLFPDKLFRSASVEYDGRLVYDSLPPWPTAGSLSAVPAGGIFCGRLSHSIRDSLVIATSRSFELDATVRVRRTATVYLISAAAAETSSVNPWSHIYIADAANDTCIYAYADSKGLAVNTVSNADSVTIWFWGPNAYFYGGLYHIFHNGKPIADLSPDVNSSGLLQIPAIRLTGSDTIVAMSDVVQGLSSYSRWATTVLVTRPSPSRPEYRMSLDSVHEIPPSGYFSMGLPFVLVTVGPAHLTKERDSVMVSSAQLPLNGDTFYVSFERTGPIDWKLSFGASQSVPYYSPGVAIWVDSTLHGLGLKFTATPAFSYPQFIDTTSVTKVYVTFVYGPKDSISATPQLLIACGAPPNAMRLAAVYQISPATPLHRGETWYAGDLSIPDMKFKPAGPVRLSKVQAAP
jgi:hypothetical protein